MRKNLRRQSLFQSFSLDPGVYLFFGKKGKVIYVGKAKNLKKRISSYFQKNLGEKTSLMVSELKGIKTINVESEIESLLLEAKLIQKYYPKFNVRFADGKAYPLIRITIKDKYPKVLTVRRMDDPKSIYFGPYPNVGAMRTVLKISRKIFPFVSVSNHPNKICFYKHLGLCPCPQVTNDSSYKNNIKHLIDFLNGKTKKVLKDLKNERDVFSKKEEFEKANETQRKIDAILLVTSPFYSPLQYEENINLAEDLRQIEVEEFKKILQKEKLNVTNLERIECYDISNISGKFATGSLVVFTNGEKDSKWYRRFKIKKDGIPNDVAMMAETLRRRFNNDWPLPNLIIVDGGKGQVSVATKVLSDMNLKIPIIGIAKREEIVILQNFKEVRLSKDSNALHLIMRIRDEAHRFAISYHKLLRSKFLTSLK